MFVVDIDTENNTVILGDNDDLFTKEFIASDLNWISIEKLDKPINVKAKIRYKAPEQSAIISPIENDMIKVVFNEKQRAVTPGQSVVFYNNDIVVGGGIIKEII